MLHPEYVMQYRVEEVHRYHLILQFDILGSDSSSRVSCYPLLTEYSNNDVRIRSKESYYCLCLPKARHCKSSLNRY